MNARSVRNLIAATSLLGTWAVAIGCEGDPPKHSAFDDGGAGGEAGDGRVQVPAEAGAGAADNNGGVGASMGGVPDTGGVAATAGAATGGVPSEPTAGDGSVGGDVAVGGAGNVVACEGVVTFPDSYFEQSVRDAIGKPDGPILGDDLAELKSFTMPGIDGTIDITGMECMVALEEVNFANNALGTPLSTLAKLPNLRKLDLSNDYLDSESVADVAQLTQLTDLNLEGNAIRSFDFVTDLVNLETLNLSHNNNFAVIVSDLTPLSGLVHLKTLSLDFAYVDSIAPLASLTALESLSLKALKFTDASPLKKLVNLTSLDISETKVTSIADLAGLTKLQKLDLSYAEPTSFAPLQGLTTLTELNLRQTKLASLAPLAPLVALTTLDVADNTFSDVTVLGALPALQQLDISYNAGITSLAPLVSSSYIGANDAINVEGLDCTTFAAAFTALTAKNVTLNSGCGT